MGVYALYKGNEMILIGTVKEIAESMNIKEATVMHYQTPTYRKRTSEEKGLRLIKLKDDKEV